jgi:hypothetical protein
MMSFFYHGSKAQIWEADMEVTAETQSDAYNKKKAEAKLHEEQEDSAGEKSNYGLQ